MPEIYYLYVAVNYFGKNGVVDRSISSLGMHPSDVTGNRHRVSLTLNATRLSYDKAERRHARTLDSRSGKGGQLLRNVSHSLKYFRGRGIIPRSVVNFTASCIDRPRKILAGRKAVDFPFPRNVERVIE